MLAPSFAAQRPRSDGGEKADHWGEHEANRKTIAQGKPDVFG
jgi:hypothetical protein